MKNRFKNLINYFIAGILLLSFSLESNAQSNLGFSVEPGYLLHNTDRIQGSDGRQSIQWMYGINFSGDVTLFGHDARIQAGYFFGSEYVMRNRRNFSNFQLSDVELEYQSVPIEIMLKTRLSERVEYLVGFNISGINRILQYQNVNLTTDRVFSLGAGVSASARARILQFGNMGPSLHAGFVTRYTHYFYHHENGRDMSDFTMNHLMLSPVITLGYRLR